MRGHKPPQPFPSPQNTQNLLYTVNQFNTRNFMEIYLVKQHKLTATTLMISGAKLIKIEAKSQVYKFTKLTS